MRGKSHRELGLYLARNYMSHVPEHRVRSFLMGCVEPDRNPVTYLKGSLRCQWLRGHNYRNARRYMRALSWRLERKRRLHVLDFYALGKLIHYTADAFTCAHNDFFPTALGEHREYEQALQEHFLHYLESDPRVDIRLAKSIMEAIGGFHREYCRMEESFQTDSHFALSACCCILAILTANKIL